MSEQVFCDQCGAQLKPAQRFCTKCGAANPSISSLRADGRATVAQASRTSVKLIILVVVLLLGTAAVITLAPWSLVKKTVAKLETSTPSSGSSAEAPGPLFIGKWNHLTRASKPDETIEFFKDGDVSLVNHGRTMKWKWTILDQDAHQVARIRIDFPDRPPQIIKASVAAGDTSAKPKLSLIIVFDDGRSSWYEQAK